MRPLGTLALAQGATLPAICLGFGFALVAERPRALISFGGISLAPGLGALCLGWTDGLLQLAVALLALAV